MAASEEKRSVPALTEGLLVTPTVRLTQPLREGGMGAVWLADHTSLKTKVVVKFMLGELGSSESARLRFSREAAAAAKVKSPHVVQMHDHGVTDAGLPFIVMEFLEGHDLGKELQQKGPLPPAKVVPIIAQVARALSKVHAAGLLHRDIKPDNIFLVASDDDDVYVKLLDFGIAKSHEGAEGESTTMDGQTKTGQVVGTPFYMSPEQVTAQKSIDTRSDLWALGVVAFEALTGQRPFDGPSFGALAVKIATGETPKITDVDPNLPSSLDTFFVKALARAPERRFATAKELAEALRAAFEGVVSLPPNVHSMSDSGPRAKSASGSNEVNGPVSIDPDGDGRPSFVLASTLAKSEHGLAINDAKTTPDSEEKKSTPKAAIFAAVAVILLVGILLLNIGPKDPPPADAKKPLTPATRVVTPATGALPTAKPHASPSATGIPTATPSETATAEPTPSASASSSPPPKPSGAAAAWPPARPTTAPKPSAKPSAEPRPTAAPSGTVDVY